MQPAWELAEDRGGGFAQHFAAGCVHSWDSPWRLKSGLHGSHSSQLVTRRNQDCASGKGYCGGAPSSVFGIEASLEQWLQWQLHEDMGFMAVSQILGL